MSRTIRAALCALSLSSCSLSATALELPTVAGRSVSELLREARSDNIRVIFTDQLVPPTLRVSAEPRAREPLKRLREILHSHALALEEVSSGVYVVKRERTAPLPQTTAALSSAPLAQVEVTASRYTVDAVSAGESLSLVSADIQRQPALLHDAARSIRQFPGTAGQDLSARTFVRGGVPEDNLVLLDGVPLYEPWHLQALPLNFSVIDPALIGRMDFYSGVLPVEYGDRMGGLVDMHLRDPAEAFGGRVALSSLDASALLSGALPADSGDWLVFGRRGFFGSAVYARDWDVGRPQMSDAFGHARYRLDDETSLTFGALGARDHVALTTYGKQLHFDDDSSRTYAWTSYEKNGTRLRSRTTLSYTATRDSRRDELREVPQSVGSLDDQRTFRSALLQQSWTLPLPEGAMMRWGASLREDRAQYDFHRHLSFQQDIASSVGRVPDMLSESDASPSLHEQEVYWGLNQRVLPQLWLDAGMRAGHARYSTGQRDFAWDPRASLRFDASPATRVRLSAGRMTQIWTAAELPVEQDREIFDEPSVSSQYVLALEHDFGVRFSVRAEVFRKNVAHPQPRLENIFSKAAFVPDLRADSVVVRPESSRMRGMDLYATANFTGYLHGWLSYSRSSAVDIIDGGEVRRPWDQPRALGIGLAAESRAWLASADLIAHTNWPARRLFTSTIQPALQYGTGHTAQGPNYISLNVKAGYRVHFASGSLQLAIEASNATNRMNYCCGELYFGQDPFIGTVGARQGDRYWLRYMSYATLAWEFGEPRAR